MIIELLTTAIVVLAVLIVLAVLLQEGKSDMGLGSAGRQMLFGGSGGQSMIEKTTWVLGFLLIVLALGLTIAKTKDRHHSVVSSFGNFVDDSPLAKNSSPVADENSTIISDNTPTEPITAPVEETTSTQNA
ncbi:preprotein translocase subunit SecG [Candidatus Dependentiae bacterium]|nr:preprotein translocase subunit SecG [Candidatus Dependentiae bacterium]